MKLSPIVIVLAGFGLYAAARLFKGGGIGSSNRSTRPTWAHAKVPGASGGNPWRHSDPDPTYVSSRSYDRREAGGDPN